MTSTTEAPATEPAADASNGRGRGRKAPDSGADAAGGEEKSRVDNKFGVRRRTFEFDLEPVKVESMEPLRINGETLRRVSHSVSAYLPPTVSAAQAEVTLTADHGNPGYANVTVSGPVAPPA